MPLNPGSGPASTAYSQTLDTMLSTCLETYTKDPVNLFLDGGEKFLATVASKGRIFVVNDAAALRHPFIYDHGEDSTYYMPDDLGHASGTGNLSNVATELLSQTAWSMQAATRNINFPQSQPAGNLIDYVSNVMKANFSSILNEEECLFVRGVNTASGAEALNSPFENDDAYNVGLPMSLPAIYSVGKVTATHTFGGLACDDTTGNTRWAPGGTAVSVSTGGGSGGSANGDYGDTRADLYSDLQKAILAHTYSETERPTNMYTTSGCFEAFLKAFRVDAALPDPVSIDMGKEGTIPFGGITIDWSRYLSLDAVWDTDGAADVSTVPMLGVNWNSLRLNLVRSGSPSGNSADLTGKIGWINQVSDLTPHPLTVTLFKRIEWKRQWSLDNGRRSFFNLCGNQNTDHA